MRIKINDKNRSAKKGKKQKEGMKEQSGKT